MFIIFIDKKLGVLISAICENTFLVSSCLKNYRIHDRSAAAKLYVGLIANCSLQCGHWK